MTISRETIVEYTLFKHSLTVLSLYERFYSFNITFSFLRIQGKFIELKVLIILQTFGGFAESFNHT